MDVRAIRPSCHVLLYNDGDLGFIFHSYEDERTFYLASPDTILRVSPAVIIWRADPRLGRVASWKECRDIGRVKR